MKILLVDVDSKIPNLALMKLSSYWKCLDADVTLKRLMFSGYPNNKKKFILDASGYDKVYASIVFSNNKGKLDIINCNSVLFGGTGHNINTELPEEIDHTEEDYSIYPDNKSSYGFITRGCIRNCYFCFVPQKEGNITYYKNWRQIVRHKTTYFLDNNILSFNGHKQILGELIENKIRCQFNQGLDIRLIDDENAKLLAEMNYLGEYIFAFDNVKYEKMIQTGLNIFRKYFDKHWRIKMFIYCHPSMLLQDVIYRIEWCRNRKILPYLMRDQECWKSEHKDFYVDLAAYCNQPGLFKFYSFEDFCMRRHPNNVSRAMSSLSLYGI